VERGNCIIAKSAIKSYN